MAEWDLAPRVNKTLNFSSVLSLMGMTLKREDEKYPTNSSPEIPPLQTSSQQVYTLKTIHSNKNINKTDQMNISPGCINWNRLKWYQVRIKQFLKN